MASVGGIEQFSPLDNKSGVLLLHYTSDKARRGLIGLVGSEVLVVLRQLRILDQAAESYMYNDMRWIEQRYCYQLSRNMGIEIE